MEYVEKKESCPFQRLSRERKLFELAQSEETGLKTLHELLELSDEALCRGKLLQRTLIQVMDRSKSSSGENRHTKSLSVVKTRSTVAAVRICHVLSWIHRLFEKDFEEVQVFHFSNIY